MYRPEGWENPHNYMMAPITGKERDNSLLARSYEAGADAMLEGLKARGTVLYVPANHWLTSLPIIQPVSGSWVFIPEEEYHQGPPMPGDTLYGVPIIEEE